MKTAKSILLYIITIVVIVFAIVWEYYMQQWLKAQPKGGEEVMRTDLFVLYPLVLTLVALSLYNIFKKRTE